MHLAPSLPKPVLIYDHRARGDQLSGSTNFPVNTIRRGGEKMILKIYFGLFIDSSPLSTTI